MEELTKEINQALHIDDDVFLAFDVFNTKSTYTDEERITEIAKLINFYGQSETSNFQNQEVKADGLFKFQGCINDSTKFFFEDFYRAVSREEKKNNGEIETLVKNGKLKRYDIDSYKDEHPVQGHAVYAVMTKDRELYPELMKLFKLSLLITPSTANVERGFSVLNLVHTKQRNRLMVKSLDRLMRIVLVGPAKFTDEEYEVLIDKYDNMANRRIEL